MPKRFVLKSDSRIRPDATAGTVAYQCVEPDYGLASDDTRHTGRMHISLTLDPAGGYPFFTHPADDLEEVDQ